MLRGMLQALHEHSRPFPPQEHAAQRGRTKHPEHTARDVSRHRGTGARARAQPQCHPSHSTSTPLATDRPPNIRRWEAWHGLGVLLVWGTLGHKRYLKQSGAVHAARMESQLPSEQSRPSRARRRRRRERRRGRHATHRGNARQVHTVGISGPGALLQEETTSLAGDRATSRRSHASPTPTSRRSPGRPTPTAPSPRIIHVLAEVTRRTQAQGGLLRAGIGSE